MPFQRYLQHDLQDRDSDLQYDPTQHMHGAGSTFSSPLQFQIPQFMMFGPPTLAPGGGAEVLPPSMFAGTVDDINSAWLSNNLLSTKYPDDRSTFAIRYNASSATAAISHDPAILSSDPMGMYTHLNHIPQPGASDAESGVDLALTAYPPAPVVSTEARDQIHLDSSVPFTSPSPYGLPIYSTSGFDLLSIMARVVTRPNQTVTLGPVDMSCSFVVVDVRRHDDPIVYASPTFRALTGYEEHEILGRNCRFLQSPTGCLQKGEERRFTSPIAVAHMKKCLVADKECQITIVNYRKGGSAFNNLVSIIPVPGGVSNLPEEADQVAYHIGFQVDLADQPNAILQRLRSGTCAINYNHSQLARSPNPITTMQKDRRINSASSVVPVSKNLRSLLGDDGFVKSIPISTSTTLNHAFVSSSSGDKGSNADAYDGNQFLSMLLLESGPDFVHVLSLRGAFLYVAPSIRRVLGYDPEEVVGKSVSDYCHPADLVPLMRELKESSATLSPENRGGFSTQLLPKKVDLLFRIMSKSDGYVWVESRGRLHVEPGKGRKAIILSGRTRGMPRLMWGPVAHAGGLVTPSVGGTDEEANEREFWGVLNQIGTFLSVGGAVRDVLGWSVDEVIGKHLEDFIDTSMMGRDANFNPLQVVNDAIQLASSGSKPEYTQVSFDMRKKNGNKLHVIMIVYHSTAPSTHPPEPVICQIKMATPTIHAPIMYPTTSDVFEELDTKRNTSWQYELQQLKFANERLLEEVQTLESRSKRNQPHHQTSRTTFSTLAVHKTTDDWAPTYEGLQIEHTRHWEAGPI